MNTFKDVEKDLVQDPPQHEERRELRVSIFKGLMNPSKFDAHVSTMAGTRYSFAADRAAASPETSLPLLDRWLRGGLFYTVGQVHRQVRKDARWLTVGSLLLWVCLWMLIHVLFFDTEGGELHSLLGLYAIIIVWTMALDRFVIFPRLHEHMEKVVVDLSPRFAREGWKLEYVIEEAKSLAGVAAFFQISPVEGKADNIEQPTRQGVVAETTMDEQEEWVSVYRNMYARIWCQSCTAQQVNLYDGIPKSMQGTVDVFLWGALVESLSVVTTNFVRSKMCSDCGVRILAILLYIASFVVITILVVLSDHVQLLLGTVFVSVAVYVVLQLLLSSCSDARLSKERLHPAARDVVEEFAPHFAGAGYIPEYVTDEQAIPNKFLARWLPKAGQGFVRFVPSSQAYVKIPESSSTNGGWTA
jgi:hypothetical protein